MMPKVIEWLNTHLILFIGSRQLIEAFVPA